MGKPANLFKTNGTKPPVSGVIQSKDKLFHGGKFPKTQEPMFCTEHSVDIAVEMWKPDYNYH